MYKRFFAFGCSFTDYQWTTWADIVAAAYPGAEYFNLGRGSTSNQLILYRMMEADQLYNFNKEDLIIVQWTGVTRETIWKDGHWTGGGNVYNKNVVFSKEYLDNYTSILNYMIRDHSIIKAVQSFLSSKPCTHYQICMSSPSKTENIKSIELDSQDIQDIEYLTKLYKPCIDLIKPSYMEIIFNNEFSNHSRPLIRLQDGRIINDVHPTPAEHLTYIETVLPEIPITQEIRNNVQVDTDIIMAPGKINSNAEWGNTEQLTVNGTVDRKHKEKRIRF